MIKNQTDVINQTSSVKFQLFCPQCQSFIEDHYTLRCSHHDNLIQSKYTSEKFVNPNKKGIWKYSNWLPIESEGQVNSGPITYHAKQLGKELGLSQLFISFNGYWPEKGAKVKSCTFKEYEALITFQRIIDHDYKGVFLASAGNTARAFAQTSQKVGIPSIIFVPESNLENLWSIQEDFRNIHVVSLVGDSDYTDAIQLAGKFTDQNLYVPEGGARNVARRDGMSTVMYDFVYHFNSLPDHYFQGVGSGTGAIAAWEAAQRFINLEKFGTTLPKLQLGQNHPYDPLVQAWELKQRNLDVNDFISNPKAKIKSLEAIMLSNRTPPYSVAGGLFDALSTSNGNMYAVSNSQVRKAMKMFENIEGIDIVPEAGVALASLNQAINQKQIHPDDKILVNITGGGYKRLEEDNTLYRIPPTIKYRDENDIPLIRQLFT